MTGSGDVEQVFKAIQVLAHFNACAEPQVLRPRQQMAHVPRAFNPLGEHQKLHVRSRLDQREQPQQDAQTHALVERIADTVHEDNIARFELFEFAQRIRTP